MSIPLSLEILDELDSEAIAIGIDTYKVPFSSLLSYLDWRFCGQLTQLAQQDKLPKHFGETLILSNPSRVRPLKIFFFGLMKGNHNLPDPIMQVNYIISILNKAKVTSCAFALPNTNPQFLEAVHLLEQSPLPFTNKGIFETHFAAGQE